MQRNQAFADDRGCWEDGAGALECVHGGKSCHCILVDIDAWGKAPSTSANEALWLFEDFYWSEKLEKLHVMMTLT